jgi:hypothetical protein
VNALFKNLLLSAIPLCSVFSVYAQADTLTQPKETADTSIAESKHGYAKAYLKYLSNAVYSGRTADMPVGYITPIIEYNFKSGIYFNGSASFAIAEGVNRIDNYALEGGYSFSAFKDRFDATIGITKYFYNDSSENVRSVLDGAAFSYLSYELKHLYFDGSVYASFGSGADLSLGFGAGHHFYAFDEALSVSPNISLTAGTQHYLSKFANRKKQRRGRSNQPVLSDNSRFRVLDYELAVPVTFETGKWSFTVKPVYAVPVNAVVYANNPQNSEQLKNQLFGEIEVTFKF